MCIRWLFDKLEKWLTKFIHYLLFLFKFTFIRFNTHLKGYNMCELLNYRTDNSAPTWIFAQIVLSTKHFYESYTSKQSKASN